MKFLPLGDREVSVIGLGCQQFGSPEWRWGPDQGEAAANQVVNRALDLGVNFFDTAEIYGNGRSEEILGSALRGRREEAFVATKVSPVHGTRRGVADACERSLRRLGMALRQIQLGAAVSTALVDSGYESESGFREGDSSPPGGGQRRPKIHLGQQHPRSGGLRYGAVQTTLADAK